MKFQFIAISATLALLCSCGQKKSEAPVTETTNDTEVMEEVSVDTIAVPVEAQAAPSSSQSNNWDALLDEYEDYMTQAVKMAKKAQSGDMSAMTEYASLLEKAESLQKKLENAENDMTAAQVARLNKIAAKLAQQMM